MARSMARSMVRSMARAMFPVPVPDTPAPPEWQPLQASGGDEVFDVSIGEGLDARLWRVHIFRNAPYDYGPTAFFQISNIGGDGYDWIEYLIVDPGGPGGYGGDVDGGGGGGGAVLSSVQGDVGSSGGRPIQPRLVVGGGVINYGYNAIFVHDLPSLELVTPNTANLGTLTQPSAIGTYPNRICSMANAGSGGVGATGSPYADSPGSGSSTGGGGAGVAGAQYGDTIYGYAGADGPGGGGGGAGSAASGSTGGSGVISTITGVAIEYGRGGDGGVLVPMHDGEGGDLVDGSGRGGDGAAAGVGQAGRNAKGCVIIRYPLQKL